ncbi:hypothetical protein M885DRAFT_515241 [Pelagophyceae sp. CCMP2097]|nr:hypothetical protein M885DRAFT_515241 [Pelagophyceae sp. CCMP2097]
MATCRAVSAQIAARLTMLTGARRTGVGAHVVAKRSPTDEGARFATPPQVDDDDDATYGEKVRREKDMMRFQRSVLDLTRRCPLLTTVVLDGATADDSAMIALADCPSLEILDFGTHRYSSVTDVGLRAIARCTRLRVLRAFNARYGDTPVTDAGVVALAECCPRLVSLALGCAEVTDSAFVALAEHCPVLETLDLCSSGNNYPGNCGDRGLTAVCERCPRLVELCVNGLFVSGPQLDSVLFTFVERSGLRLRGLALDGFSISEATMVAIASNCPGLKTLLLSGTGTYPTDRVLAELTIHCTGLEKLGLHQCVVTDVAVVALVKSLTRLKSLGLGVAYDDFDHIDPTHVTIDTLVAITKHCTLLEELSLHMWPVSLDELDNLHARYPRLRMDRWHHNQDETWPYCVQRAAYYRASLSRS